MLPLLKKTLWLLLQLVEYIWWFYHIFYLLAKFQLTSFNLIFFELDHGLNTHSWLDFLSIHLSLNNEFDEALYLRSMDEIVGTLGRSITIYRIWGVSIRKYILWVIFAAWISFSIILFLFLFYDLIFQSWKVLIDAKLLKGLFWGYLWSVWPFALQLEFVGWL